MIIRANNKILSDVDKIALGNYGDNIFSEYLYGLNPSVATGTVPEDLWNNGGTITYPTTANTINVKSSSGLDTAAGIGARTVKLIGLDVNYDLIEEIITLNGTVNVPSSLTYIRILKCFVETAGTSGTNIGGITVTHTGTGTTQLTIAPGNGESLVTHYTVPNGYTALLYNLTSDVLRSSASEEADVGLVIREFGKAFRFKNNLPSNNISSNNKDFKYPIVIPEKSDIKLVCIYVSTTTPVDGSYELKLIRN